MTTKDRPQITVAQLIELLKKEDPAALVVVEGCDCYGDATGVSRFRNTGNTGPEIVIERNP